MHGINISKINSQFLICLRLGTPFGKIRKLIFNLFVVVIESNGLRSRVTPFLSTSDNTF